MTKVNPYLNFEGKSEEAFIFYKSVFGGEFTGLFRMGDMPDPGKLSEDQKKLIMHIALPIGENVTLMASDTNGGMGQSLKEGNNVYISLHPDNRTEADRLFNGLSAGGNIEMPLADQFWGDYFGCFTDKFGIKWMVNHSKQQ